jgi:hypothetical protein
MPYIPPVRDIPDDDDISPDEYARFKRRQAQERVDIPDDEDDELDELDEELD